VVKTYTKGVSVVVIDDLRTTTMKTRLARIHKAPVIVTAQLKDAMKSVLL
jgi:predicted nicotinamide N-methyase